MKPTVTVVANLIPAGLQAEKSLHSHSGTSVRDGGRHVEDDLGEQLQLCCHALSDHGNGTGIIICHITLCFSSVSCLSVFIFT